MCSCECNTWAVMCSQACMWSMNSKTCVIVHELVCATASHLLTVKSYGARHRGVLGESVVGGSKGNPEHLQHWARRGFCQAI